MSILTKIFGDPNLKVLRKLQPSLDEVNKLEPVFEKLTDEELKGKTEEFKHRLKKGEPLDGLLPEAFCAVREASKRTTKMRHFDVQVLGAIVLHQGKIAEMTTGEGKTLVATMPLYLNALEGKGAHLVTVNDYLARRDVEWMGSIYHLLGMTVGVLNHEKAYIYNLKEGPRKTNLGSGEELKEVSRREAYQADITYGTNNEFGFDYLRDNMVMDLSQMVQRKFNYAIVDEVDSILIDEARTPLIISAPAEEATEKYSQFARLVPRLKENVDYNIDEKMRACTLTEKGIDHVEKMLGVENIYTEAGTDTVHHLEKALQAYTLYHRDKEYVVKDGEIIIVDEFTGRLMYGRRYSEGLHQAIEAKEGVPVKQESVTLATVTFQNYFRMYKKLAGMTGTAVTSAEEFQKVYNLDVVVIPTNKPLIRDQKPDSIYKTEVGKWKAVIREVRRLHEQGRPVLIGTTSVEKNEILSDLLDKEGLEHNTLNAKHHEKEAAVLAEAGRLGAVTCSTNMAGRGVDIVLGGNPEMLAREGVSEEEWQKEHDQVIKLGGLHVIGTERHEARRIDNQLRGRAGRQGDPGSSQFFVSLEDDLMRIFGGDRVKAMMDLLRLPEDQPIEHRLISRSIESAQSKVEGNNFDLRKHLLEYDDVMNKHREVIYKKRREILKNLKESKSKVLEMVDKEIEQIGSVHTATDEESQWNIEEIAEVVNTIFPIDLDSVHTRLEDLRKEAEPRTQDIEVREKIIQYLIDLAHKAYDEKEKQITPEIMRQIERAILLRTIDRLWIGHLEAMMRLREGIGLRGYGQMDPLVEYKKEAYSMFQKLLDAIQNNVVYTIYKVGVAIKQKSPMETAKKQLRGAPKTSEERKARPLKIKKKVGRNDPCPCGSGKKFKKCCMGKGIYD